MTRFHKNYHRYDFTTEDENVIVDLNTTLSSVEDHLSNSFETSYVELHTAAAAGALSTSTALVFHLPNDEDNDVDDNVPEDEVPEDEVPKVAMDEGEEPPRILTKAASPSTTRVKGSTTSSSLSSFRPVSPKPSSLPPPPSSSTSSSTSPPPSQVTILFGSDVHHFPKHLLEFAAPVLSHRLEYVDGLYVLDLQHRPNYEWEYLQPFLQPPACSKVTPAHVVVLLKWFLELEWWTLVEECDSILASLEWNAEPTTHHHDAAHQDIHDLILLANICVKCQSLTKTQRIVQQNLNRLLQMPQWWKELVLLQKLTHLMAHAKDMRQALWISLLPYVPPDLDVYEDPQALVHNPLFAYLLREGVHKMVDQRHQQLHGGPAGVVVVTPDASASTRLNGSLDGPFDELIPPSSTSSSSWGDSFQQWWNTMSVARPSSPSPTELHTNLSSSRRRDNHETPYDFCPTSSSIRNHHYQQASCDPANPHPWLRLSSSPLPSNRGEWLNGIWQHLKDPILSRPQSKNPVRVPPSPPPPPPPEQPRTKSTKPRRSRTPPATTTMTTTTTTELETMDRRKFLC